MNVSVLVCAHGADAWRELAWSRAYPSAAAQGAHEVIVEYERDSTLAAVRNQAADHATGDWLCFLDADDELDPGYVEEMVAEMGRWNLRRRGDLVYNPLLLAPAVQYVHAGVEHGPAVVPNAGRWPDLNECVIGTLVPRHLFLAAGGFRELPSLEDYDLWLRCAISRAWIQHVPGAVYRAHVNPAGGRNRDQGVYHQLRREHAQAWT